MKFLSPAVVALAAAGTPVAAAWSLLGPDDFPTTSSMTLFEQPSRLMERQRAIADRMLEQTNRMFQEFDELSAPLALNKMKFPASPYRYELVDDDKKFELTLDVPGVKMDDIDITLDKQDRFVTVRGERKSKEDNTVSMSSFSQTFSLDPSVDVDSLSASLNDGVLVVSATKDMEKLEAANPVRKIPIMAAKTETKEDTNSHVAINDKKENADEDVLDLDDVPKAKEAVKVKKDGEQKA